MNNLKTLMLMVLLAAIMIFIGGLVGGKGGMMIMLMISLGMNFFSYWFSDSVVLKMYNDGMPHSACRRLLKCVSNNLRPTKKPIT